MLFCVLLPLPAACRLPPIKCQFPVASRAASLALARNFSTSPRRLGIWGTQKIAAAGAPHPPHRAPRPPAPAPAAQRTGWASPNPCIALKKSIFWEGGGPSPFGSAGAVGRTPAGTRAHQNQNKK
jgi:hypothetical protein